MQDEIYNWLPKAQTQIQDNPVLFLDHALGSTHWSKQREVISSVFRNQRTTVPSCHGAGKSYIVSRIALAFLFAYVDSIVATTAPTFRQVENVIWREMRGAVATSKMPLGGKMLKTRYDLGPNWYAIGLSSDKPDKMQGLHAKSGHILIIVDEAAGLAPAILEAIEGLLTSKHVHLVYIGNPTVGMGPFYDSAKSPFFNRVQITAFDTPNFKMNRIRNTKDLMKFKTLEEVSSLPLVYPQLVTPAWAWLRLQEWGEWSPMYQSRVCAEFPSEGTDTLIPLHLVERATRKKFPTYEWKMRPVNNVIGIDVARFGEDLSVCTALDNYKEVGKDWHAGKDTMQTCGMAIALMHKLGWTKQNTKFVVDDTGVGGGVTDRLSELGYEVIPVNNASASSDPETFYNIKAEIWWFVRSLFLNDEISLLTTGRTIAELPTIRYNYRSNAQLEIVSKAQMKKDGFKSPDFADSLALACWGVACASYGGVDPNVGKGKTLTSGLMNKKF